MNSRPRRIVEVFALSFAAIVACAAPAGSADPDTVALDALELRSSLGAIFLHRRDIIPYNIYRRANKACKPYLYAVLRKTDALKYHASALRILGYLGTDQDVAFVENRVKTRYEGVLDNDGRESLRASFDALGIMAAQGCVEAEKAIERMSQLDYWKDAKFQWRDREIEGPSVPAETVAAVVYGNRCAPPDKLRAQVERVLQQSTGLERHSKNMIAALADLKLLAGQAQNMKLAEQATIAAEELEALASLAARNANLYASCDADAATLTWLTDTRMEALAEFDKFAAAITSARPLLIVNALLDNGKVLEARHLQARLAEFTKDLLAEKEVLTALGHPNYTASTCSVRRDTLFDVVGDQPEKIRGTVQKETVWFTATLANSAETVQKFFVKQRGTTTVTRDGLLLIVMMKVDGKWFWNPFGW